MIQSGEDVPEPLRVSFTGVASQGKLPAGGGQSIFCIGKVVSPNLEPGSPTSE
jgi:hypothetical protein